MKRVVRCAIPLVALVVAWVEPRPVFAQATPAPGAGASSIPVPRPFRAEQGQEAPTAPSSPSRPGQASPVPRDVEPAPGPVVAQPGPGGQPTPTTAPPRLAPLPGLDETFKLKAAPVESTDLPLPINLATALRLSDARPLIVAATQASVWMAEAELTRAKVLWVPQLNIGFDYLRHDGGGPDFNKGIMTAPSVNFFYGGAGLIQNVAVTDVIYQPIVARQELNARQAEIQTAKNDAMMQTADAYFMVHQFRGMYAGALYAIERGHDLIVRIEQLSKELVPRVEVDRARNFVADLEQQATSAREMWRVHSADLTQVFAT